MKLSILSSEKQLQRDITNLVNKNEFEELKKIDPIAISQLSIADLEQLKKEGLTLLSQKIQNIKAIDDRAMKLMPAIGIILTLGLALIASAVKSDSIAAIHGWSAVYLAASFTLTLYGLFLCFLIIQSTEISAPGYSPNTRLEDISKKYSRHETELEYTLSLSRRIKHNALILELNGRRFRGASSCWILAIITILICYYRLGN